MATKGRGTKKTQLKRNKAAAKSGRKRTATKAKQKKTTQKKAATKNTARTRSVAKSPKRTPKKKRGGSGRSASKRPAVAIRGAFSDEGLSVPDVCERHWEVHKSDCSAFVRAVASECGLTLMGNADAITATIQGPGWTVLADGIAAAASAEGGDLVIGGLAGTEHDPARNHGHVVVVVAGELAHEKYPRAYWGTLGGTGRKNATINWAWTAADRDRVHYAARAIGATSVRVFGDEQPVEVDVGSTKAARVATFWNTLSTVVADLDADATPEARGNVRRFLLHVAWHEGMKLTARKQLANGPARSFFQLEAHRAKEAGSYADTKGWIARLAGACGRTVDEVRTGIAALPLFDSGNPNASARFPEGNVIEEALRARDLFGAYLARIAFKKVPKPLPSGNAHHAQYWFDHWKVRDPDPAKVKKAFEDACDEVDALIPV